MELTNEYVYPTLRQFQDIDADTIAEANSIREALLSNDYATAIEILTRLKTSNKNKYNKLKNSTISASFINYLDEQTRNLQVMCKTRKQGILYSSSNSESELEKMYIDYSSLYNPNAGYVPGNIVKFTHNGTCLKYICTNTCRDIEPTDTTKWAVLTEKIYSSDQSFEINDIVVYGYCEYRCIQNNQGIVPTNALYWEKTNSEYELMDGDVWISKCDLEEEE